MTFHGKRWITLGLLMTGLWGLTACSGDDKAESAGLTVYTVTPSAGPNGSIGPATEQVLWEAWTINQGSTASFTVTPDTGYHIDSVGGTCGGSLEGNTYTTDPITADCTVVASFALNSYTVTPSAEANGSIQPEGTTTVDHGASTSFTITPDFGYTIADVGGTCGGTLNGDLYTTNALTSDCTVVASFSLIAPEKPLLSLTPQGIKTFSFSWEEAGAETEYHLLENADGNSGFTEIATIAGDAASYDHRVFLPSRINAGYILEACNSAGCIESDTVFVSGSLSEATGYIKGSNTEAEDNFGYRVALAADGNTLAVGAYLEDSNTTGDDANNEVLNSGAVYVFSRDNGVWHQQAIVKAANAGAFDQFGYSVALAGDGNTLAVGARLEDSGAAGVNGDETNNAASNSGAVYVFTRDDTDWSQQAYVKASNTGAGDEFGSSVTLTTDGNTLAVAAINEDSNATGMNGDATNNAASDSGAVYVFTRSGTAWSQQAYVKASNTGADDNFGHSIALAGDGNTLAVGAINEDATDDATSDSGAVYVFSRSGADWSQQAYVKTSNAEVNDHFGHSVSLAADGNTLAVSAIMEDSSSTGIDGDEADNAAANSGAVYVFTRNGTGWNQQAYLKASNAGVGDNFGSSIALAADGNTLAAGAASEGSNARGINGEESDNSASLSGAVYVFTRDDSDWRQQAYVKASNTGANDQFGQHIALAADGKTLAVGAAHEDSHATGIHDGAAAPSVDNSASNSGAVYLY